MVKNLVHFITQALSSSEQFGDVNVEVDLVHHSDPRAWREGDIAFLFSWFGHISLLQKKESEKFCLIFTQV